MKKIIGFGLLLLLNLAGFSQEEKSYINLVTAENQLKYMFESLYNEEIIGTNLATCYAIDSLFSEALNQPGAFNFEWKKLDKIGKLKSEDGVVKVFSWLYMVNRNEYHYSAYIQIDKGGGNSEIYKLIPSDSEETRSEDFPQKIDNWHAKIYYEIVTTKFKRKLFYTLIGADFNDANSSLKTVEVMAIQRGKPVFRGDQFLVGGKVKDRIIMEYSADVAVSLRYNSELQMIVFDHIVPLHPIYQGNYQFYGPDGSYDGFRFIDGIWVLDEDVDARNRL